jgi:hypothetical protein
VGEGFQADATLGGVCLKSLEDQSADVLVDHCVT